MSPNTPGISLEMLKQSGNGGAGNQFVPKGIRRFIEVEHVSEIIFPSFGYRVCVVTNDLITQHKYGLPIPSGGPGIKEHPVPVLLDPPWERGVFAHPLTPHDLIL